MGDAVAVADHLRADGLRIILEVIVPGPQPTPALVDRAIAVARSSRPAASISIERSEKGDVIVRAGG